MTDVCLLNLAIADLLLLCALPFLAHYSRADWVFGEAMCKIILGTYYIGFYSGIFFVTLMSIDRYLAIVHAVYALKARTRTYGLIASAVVWILGVLASFPELHFIAVQSQFNSILCLVHYNTEDNFLRVFGLLKMNALGLLIPLIIIVFCNSVIISRQLYSKLMKRKTIHLVLSVVVVFFCCWVPYNVASFFKALEFIEVYTACHSSKAIRLSLQITEALAYSHTCWNPVLYVFVEKRFRKHLLHFFSRLMLLYVVSVHILDCLITVFVLLRMAVRNREDNSSFREPRPFVRKVVLRLLGLAAEELVCVTRKGSLLDV
ncbi:C-C chemokine receptor type 3-like [Scleropages formosus]|uniref:C-C chemokine receptor type 3-like n=1 Tax=Scleropages formosus TaxID=113540 RepID=UPI0010FA8CD3|nr:C-C chemokine receptor type 3-like [Scleropages formosus]